MNPIDLKSSTIEKFIDVVASAIGKLSAPYLLRKMAEAKGQELRILAESIEETRQIIGDNFEVKYQTESFQIVPTKKDELAVNSHVQRIENRLSAVEQERQKNLDNITIYGLREASKISDPSNDQVDRDWLNQFINVSQDVSSDQMQQVWGIILAREVSNPGSFSLRSLEVLRTISKHEAETFRQMVQFAVQVGDGKYIFLDHTIYSAKSAGWQDYIFLCEIGLFMPGIFGVNFHACPECNPVFDYGTFAFKVSAAKNVSFHLNAYPLSTIGKELAKLIEIIPSKEYFDKVRDDVSEKKGLKCTALTGV